MSRKLKINGKATDIQAAPGNVFVSVPLPANVPQSDYCPSFVAAALQIAKETPVAPAPKPEPPKPEPKQDPPVPVCPVLATLHRLSTRYPTWRYFILDEIFVTLRQETHKMTRDALLETLRAYFRDGQVLFRQGYGSQLQFALPRRNA